MRFMTVVRIVAIACAVLALSVATAAASDHSGTVVAVDRSAGKIVVGEVGPWQIRQRKLRVTERTFTVTPSTEFVVVKRSREAGPSGWVGELVESPGTPWAVKPGDFVTVRTRREGKGLLAEKVTVVE